MATQKLKSKKNDIGHTDRPFGKKELLKQQLFAKIGKKYGKNAAQVILRWLVQKDIPVILRPPPNGICSTI